MLLTPKQKAAYVMYRKRGMTQGQIAEQLQVSRVAVCRLIARASTRVQALRVACLAAGGDCQIVDALLV